MQRAPHVVRSAVGLSVISVLFSATQALAAAPAGDDAHRMTLWQLLVSGGWVMIPLAILSVLATASIIYHFLNVRSEKLTPRDFTENLLSLLERKEIAKAKSLCAQQPNLISEIAMQGLEKSARGNAVIEEAVQYEGKSRIEKLWQNLNYLGDMAVIAPMLGLLGTVLGMIDAFDYQAFRAGTVQPIRLAQGLSKAMITTAFGLVIAVPILAFFAYFRGRIGRITGDAERASQEIVHLLTQANADAEPSARTRR
jgi:biopolymer transport protein ExbB